MKNHSDSKSCLMLALAILVLSSSAAGEDALRFGSKASPHDPDESKPLSQFYVDPEFVFYDGNTRGLFEPGDPVYIHISPSEDTISENDVRLTPFGNFPAGSQVRITDPDIGYPITRFGTPGFSRAEVRYFDVDGDKAYSLEDPVYLDLNPGTVSSGDIRITSYLGYEAGSRARDAEGDNGRPTYLMPGMLTFYNGNGNINNGGFGIYDIGDIIYIDTQAPFLSVTVNDIRLSA